MPRNTETTEIATYSCNTINNCSESSPETYRRFIIYSLH